MYFLNGLVNGLITGFTCFLIMVGSITDFEEATAKEYLANQTGFCLGIPIGLVTTVTLFVLLFRSL